MRTTRRIGMTLSRLLGRTLAAISLVAMFASGRALAVPTYYSGIDPNATNLNQLVQSAAAQSSFLTAAGTVTTYTFESANFGGGHAINILNGYNAGAWNGTSIATTGAITSAAAQANGNRNTAIGYADWAGDPQSIVALRLARAEAFWLEGKLAEARREAELADDVADGCDSWERGAVAVWLRRTGSARSGCAPRLSPK